MSEDQKELREKVKECFGFDSVLEAVEFLKEKGKLTKAVVIVTRPTLRKPRYVGEDMEKASTSLTEKDEKFTFNALELKAAAFDDLVNRLPTSQSIFNLKGNLMYGRMEEVANFINNLPLKK